ncbi:MAG TPA: Hsp20/alpha crystallin family protein [Candidatus Nitrosotenuis sp.]|nr:Hsp20/alpha crystallin family protein [Candidatus Nitrosotenuis sp.]
MRIGSLVPFEHKKQIHKSNHWFLSRWKAEISYFFNKLCYDLGTTFPENQEIKIDVCNDKDHMIIMAELPGVHEEDLALQFRKGTLTIQGIKRQEIPENNYQFYVSERCYGTFNRSFHIPSRFDLSKAKKELAHGVLILTIPKKKKHPTI